jgi:hypothetical protein
LEREIERAKKSYPEAKFVGIADGAETNWKFLEKHTDEFWISIMRLVIWERWQRHSIPRKTKNKKNG